MEINPDNKQGAAATGLDISDKALNVARSYYDSIRESVSAALRTVDLQINNARIAGFAIPIVIARGSFTEAGIGG